MHLALHFDPRDAGMVYGPDLEAAAFRSLLRIPSPRLHVRIRHGSLLTHELPKMSPEQLGAVLMDGEQPSWTGIDVASLKSMLATTHPWVLAVEGLTGADAKLVSLGLRRDCEFFIGALVINLANPVHWALYEAYLPLAYRVLGRELRLLHTSFQVAAGDERDHVWADEWRASGLFESVQWEDIGLRDSILDELHTYDHVRHRVELEELLSGHLAVLAADALLRCASLDPALSEKLYAAFKSFEFHDSSEQLAQVALSCRRFLEKLADVLYPPGPARADGRKVGQAEYRNRLWAYVEDHLDGTDESVALVNLKDLGDRVDRLDELANKGVHAREIDARAIHRLLISLVVLSSDLLSIAPPPLAASNAPYEPALREFVKRLADREQA
jgi:hypothetical protein